MNRANGKVGRLSTACDNCKAKKRRCDGLVPCQNCKKQTIKICTYSTLPYVAKKTSVKEIQNKLYDICTRRKYFEAYFAGCTPAVLFSIVNSDCIGKYDNPISKSTQLQYNSILASSTRSFGAPEKVYSVFENNAKRLAKELMTDFTPETALGFHFLSVHYWASNLDLCAHYRDISVAICKKALKKTNYEREMNFLIGLSLVTIGINDNEDPNEVSFLLNNLLSIVQAENPNVNTNILTIDGFVKFASMHAKLSSILYFTIEEGKIVNFKKTSDEDYHFLNTSFVGLYNMLMSNINLPQTTILLINGIHNLLLGINNYFYFTSNYNFFNIEMAVSLFCDHSQLIGIGGPRFIAIFDAAFKIAYVEKHYNLANRIVGLQRKQAALFHDARTFVERNMNLMRNATNEEIQKSVTNFFPLFTKDKKIKFEIVELENVY